MHDCQKFREDWIDGSAEVVGVDCEDCRSFCQEAQMVLQATETAAPPVPEYSEEYWDQYDRRLRGRLEADRASKVRAAYVRWGSLTVAAAAVAAVVTFAPGRTTTETTVKTNPNSEYEYVDDHIQGLDPRVVVFLGQSELFLRDFTKIESDYADYAGDLDEAKARAKRGLMELAEQKTRAGDFSPVRMALDEYESVLREIKNLDRDDDVADIQTRIRSNGLIANLKAYQPQVMQLSSWR